MTQIYANNMSNGEFQRILGVLDGQGTPYKVIQTANEDLIISTKPQKVPLEEDFEEEGI